MKKREYVVQYKVFGKWKDDTIWGEDELDDAKDFLEMERESCRSEHRIVFRQSEINDIILDY